MKGDILGYGAMAALVILALVMMLATYRLVKGPHVSDRVIALDLVAVMAIGMMAGLAVLTDQPSLVDAGLLLGLLAFISTVAFAKYLEGEK